ncbi:MAG: hypothetical protein LUE98_11120 [Tannerellaceae bacterium]|nr:hypothetical protein [Tannerellaceae bacterium]
MNVSVLFILSLFPFTLQNGDLIFQEACKGETEDTIKEVITSAGEYNFTHVGMVYIDER